MKPTINNVHLGEVQVVITQVFEDHHGFFMEAFRADECANAGLPTDFVQDCTATNGTCESGIRWDNPQIGIEWPVACGDRP